jgi:spore coat polysaccharide biosynthesis protein SpsF (cytidylyltransferase family)
VKTLAIVQCRLGSSRLPGKALEEIDGVPMIRRVVKRVQEMRGLDAIVVAVPPQDMPAIGRVVGDLAIVGCCNRADNDVLGRYAYFAESEDADVILRVTGDCPLWNPREGERVLAALHADPSLEFASNVTPGYVDGEDAEAFTRAALRWADREATLPYDREHVTSWMRRHVKTTTVYPVTPGPKPKTSVDTVEDLQYVRELVAQRGDDLLMRGLDQAGDPSVWLRDYSEWGV